MRVAHIVLHAIEGNTEALRGAAIKIDGVVVWPYSGWYADMRLEEVTGPEFAGLEDAIKKSSKRLRFRDGHDRYDYLKQVAFVEIHDRDLVQYYVERGALTDPKVTVKLAKRLETLIRELSVS